MMLFRNAVISDISQMQIVRNAVKENALSNPDFIKDADYVPFLAEKGRGWVCETDNKIVCFAFVDLSNNNVWALFVLPEYEKKGIGKHLHQLMLDWYFNQTIETLWLGTTPNTRAEIFYRYLQWTPAGKHGKNEVKFEMTYENWMHPK